MEDSALSGATAMFQNAPCYVHAGNQHHYSANYYSEMDKAGFYNNIKYEKKLMTADLHIADNEPGRHLRSLLMLGWENDNKAIIQFSAAYQGTHKTERETETDSDGYDHTISTKYICQEITNVISIDVVRQGNYDTGAVTMLQSLSEGDAVMTAEEKAALEAKKKKELENQPQYVTQDGARHLPRRAEGERQRARNFPRRPCRQ